MKRVASLAYVLGLIVCGAFGEQPQIASAADTPLTLKNCSLHSDSLFAVLSGEAHSPVVVHFQLLGKDGTTLGDQYVAFGMYGVHARLLIPDFVGRVAIVRCELSDLNDAPHISCGADFAPDWFQRNDQGASLNWMFPWSLFISKRLVVVEAHFAVVDLISGTSSRPELTKGLLAAFNLDNRDTTYTVIRNTDGIATAAWFPNAGTHRVFIGVTYDANDPRLSQPSPGTPPPFPRTFSVFETLCFSVP